MPSIVTRLVITSSAKAIRLNWRQVVDDREGRRQWKSATMAIGGFSLDVEWRSWWTLTLTLRQKPFQVRGFWRRYCSRRTGFHKPQWFKQSDTTMKAQEKDSMKPELSVVGIDLA